MLIHDGHYAIVIVMNMLEYDQQIFMQMLGNVWFMYMLFLILIWRLKLKIVIFVIEVLSKILFIESLLLC